MRIEFFEYLIEVSKTKSMTAASENLHVSQQTISLAIKNLEIDLGLTLLKRTNRGVEMTEAGEYILKEIALILEGILRMRTYSLNHHNLQDKESEKTGTLKISCAPMLNSSILPLIMKEFMLLHPNVNILLSEKKPELCKEDI